MHMQLKSLASKGIKGENVENRQAFLPVAVGRSGLRIRPRVFSAKTKKIGNGEQYGPPCEHQLQTAPREIC